MYRKGRKSIIESYCQIGVIPVNTSSKLTTVFGEKARIRSFTVIYSGNQIGNNFQTGHGVLIREDNLIGDNVSIGSHTVIEHHITIGNNVRIHSNSFIPEYSRIEDNVWIGPMVTLTNAKYPASPHAKKRLTGVLIKKGAKIGAGSIILPGIKIGENALVGAGCVVTKDVPDGAVVAGNPARIINKTASLRYADGIIAYP